MIRGAPIDFALALLDSIRLPHETFNTREIASVVNMLIEEGFGSGFCRHQDIYFLELRALKKVGHALIRSGVIEEEDKDRLFQILNGKRYAHVGGIQKANYRRRKLEREEAA